MTQNQAIKTIAPGQAEIVDESIPALPAEDYILVKTTAVAVNPTDWKHVEWANKYGCVGIWVGCDYAGVVEEVGPGVTKKFAKGDRICGGVNGSNGLRKIDGSFAQYIVVKGDLQIHIPGNISDEEAATLGIAVTTIGQGLYENLKLPLPNEPTKSNDTILIYGGSTAMGIFGIQYAKLSGLTVVATASPHNFDYLKSLGADHVFDYKSDTVSKDIRKVTNDKLKLAWDCQSSKDSLTITAKAMSSEGGRIGTLLPLDTAFVKDINKGIEVEHTVYYNVFGEPYKMVQVVEPGLDAYEFGKKFWEISRELLEQGKLKPIRIIKNRGGEGLKGVLHGLHEMQAGKVSAAKLVYTL